jgi:hypothetical protein
MRPGAQIFHRWLLPPLLLLLAGGCSYDLDRTWDSALWDSAPPDSAPPDAAAQIPTTTVGKQLAWFIGAVNSGGLDATAFMNHFSSSYRAARPYSSFVSRYGNLIKGQPLTYLGCDAGATDTQIYAHLYGAGNKSYSRLGMSVSVAAPNPIIGFTWSGAPNIDPAYGTIGQDELGLRPYDPNKSSSGMTFKIDLLDRKTGKPLSPAVTGSTDDKYGYVRLKIPAGQTEVGVRVTHPDGQVTDNYGPFYKGSTELEWRAASFNKGAFSYYAPLVSLTLDAAKAQIWGITMYGPPPAGAPTTFNKYVGCATASFNPAVSTIFYTGPPKSLPSTTPKHTNPSWPSFFAFNLAPASHTVSVTAATHKLDATFPPLVAGNVTTMWLVYDAAVFKTNPTPSGCKP